MMQTRELPTLIRVAKGTISIDARGLKKYFVITLNDKVQGRNMKMPLKMTL